MTNDGTLFRRRKRARSPAFHIHYGGWVISTGRIGMAGAKRSLARHLAALATGASTHHADLGGDEHGDR